MLKIIRELLLQIVDRIDTGNTNLNADQMCDVIKILGDLNEPQEEMSKSKVAEYLGKSPRTIQNWIDSGILPKGRKVEGFKEHRWYKSDIDVYLFDKNK